jgi:hypothetical protein
MAPQLPTELLGLLLCGSAVITAVTTGNWHLGYASNGPEAVLGWAT